MSALPTPAPSGVTALGVSEYRDARSGVTIRGGGDGRTEIESKSFSTSDTNRLPDRTLLSCREASVGYSLRASLGDTAAAAGGVAAPASGGGEGRLPILPPEPPPLRRARAPDRLLKVV